MTKSTWDYNWSATESRRDYNRSEQAKEMAGQCHKKSILCGSDRFEIYATILRKNFTQPVLLSLRNQFVSLYIKKEKCT